MFLFLTSKVHSIARRQSSDRNEEVGITCRVGKTDARSGTRNSSRTEIPSSEELALTNKERMVGLVGQFRLAPPYYSCPKSRRSNKSKNFAVRREAECSVIEAEDKESANGERFETYHLGLVPESSSQGEKRNSFCAA